MRISMETRPDLRQLDVLVGEWVTLISLPADPAAQIHGKTTFEWIEDGAFLLQRSTIYAPGYASTVSVIGCDEESDRYTLLQNDAHGVSRQYYMTLHKDEIKVWRDIGMSRRRYRGRFSDKDLITGQWETSEDGMDWQTEFFLAYVRLAYWPRLHMIG
jgi:hypothetical protein